MSNLFTSILIPKYTVNYMDRGKSCKDQLPNTVSPLQNTKPLLSLNMTNIYIVKYKQYAQSDIISIFQKISLLDTN